MRTKIIQRIRNVCRILICLLLTMWLISCSSDQEKPNGTAQKQQTQMAIPSDPTSVAKMFFTAIAKRDTAGALQQVMPEERSYFEKEFQNGFPPIPSSYTLEIESITEKEQAQVQMTGGSLGLDLRYKDGRWWIVK